MSGDFSAADLQRRMDGAVSVLKEEFSGLRSGRASPSLLEPVMVDAYGSKMPLKQVSNVSVPEPRSLSVQVWDRELVGAVEKAIRESSLGLNPATDGDIIRVAVPELNEERRKELVKVANQYAEQARVAIRHVRRDGMDELSKMNKAKEISDDEQHAHSGDVQKMTDTMIQNVDQLLADKEKEIMQV